MGRADILERTELMEMGPSWGFQYEARGRLMNEWSREP